MRRSKTSSTKHKKKQTRKNDSVDAGSEEPSRGSLEKVHPNDEENEDDDARAIDSQHFSQPHSDREDILCENMAPRRTRESDMPNRENATTTIEVIASGVVALAPNEKGIDADRGTVDVDSCVAEHMRPQTSNLPRRRRRHQSTMPESDRGQSHKRRKTKKKEAPKLFVMPGKMREEGEGDRDIDAENADERTRPIPPPEGVIGAIRCGDFARGKMTSKAVVGTASKQQRSRENECHDARSFAEKMRMRIFEHVQSPQKRKAVLLDAGLIVDNPGEKLVVDATKIESLVRRDANRPRLLQSSKVAPLAIEEAHPPSSSDRGGALTAIPNFDKSLALPLSTTLSDRQARDLVADVLLNPKENPVAQIIGPEHFCGPECEFKPAVEICGYDGCEAISFRAMDAADEIMSREERARLSPDDVWICATSGAIHICTADKCDSRECDQQGTIVCWKTNRSFGRIVLPSFDSETGRADYASGETSYRTGGDAYRAKAQAYISGGLLAPTPRRPPSVDVPGASDDVRSRVSRGVATMLLREREILDDHPRPSTTLAPRIAGLLLSANDDDDIDGRRRFLENAANARSSSSQRPSSFPTCVTGTTAGIVEMALDSALAKFSPSARNDPRWSRREAISAMAMAKAQARTSALQSAFGCDVDWTSSPVDDSRSASEGQREWYAEENLVRTAETRLLHAAAEARRARLEAAMSDSYVPSIQMSAIVVVSLPAIKKSPPLTDKRAAELARIYGELIWRTWTLAIASPMRSSVETETRFKQFAFGTMYQAKNGYAVPFDVTTVEEYASDPEPVDAAIDAEYFSEHPRADRTSGGEEEGDGSTTPTREYRRAWFAERHSIRFLKLDKYLMSRLVSENRVGQKGTTVDGIQTESVGVNGGISLVEEALSSMAEWSKRRFVVDAQRIRSTTTTAAGGGDGGDDAIATARLDAVAKIRDRNRVMQISD